MSGIGGRRGAGSGVSCEKRGLSFEVYIDPTPLATGEESGSAGIAVASASPGTTVPAVPWSA